jgi:hypothetical protein
MKESGEELAQFLADPDNLSIFLATANILSLGFVWTGKTFVHKSKQIKD